jgi:hypothetical protein
MPPAVAATTVNTSQSNTKLENGIMAFTVTSFLLFSCVAFRILCTTELSVTLHPGSVTVPQDAQASGNALWPQHG